MGGNPGPKNHDHADADRTARLHQALRRARLPVQSLSARGDELRVELGSAEGALEVEVLPRDTPGGAYATTARFKVRFQGTGALGAGQQAVLDRFVRVLARVEPRLPARFGDADVGTGRPRAPHRVLPREFPFCTVERSEGPLGATFELLLRVTARCNQACPYCSGPATLAEPTSEALQACATRAATLMPGIRVSVTGGEPLLRPDLPGLVGQMLAFPDIELVRIQTNGVLVDRAPPVPSDPRLRHFVSLHAVQEALYDRCTGSKGQLPRALAGLRTLLGQGHRTSINCVVTRLNVDHLDEVVREVAALSAVGPVDELHFSILMCPAHRPAAADQLVRYSRVAPRLEKASLLGQKLGVRVAPLLASSHAAIPACLLSPAFRRRAEERRDRIEHDDDAGGAWISAPVCRGCREEPWCLGLPRPYYERFGDQELSPIGDDE